MTTSVDWPLPQPFVRSWQIQPQHIDHYNHTNNAAYVTQLERLAWQHSNALGLTIERYRELDRGMAISRHEIDYLAPTLVDEVLLCATWIIRCDGRLRLTRQFHLVRQDSGAPVLAARTDFVCIALSSGRPKKMPEAYTQIYGAACVSSKNAAATRSP